MKEKKTIGELNDENIKLKRELEKALENLSKNEKLLEKAKSEARKMWEQNAAVQKERGKQDKLLRRVTLADEKLKKMDDIKGIYLLIKRENEKLKEQNKELIEKNSELRKDIKVLEVKNLKLERGELTD